MIYLLSTQCLADLLTGEPEMVKWKRGKPANSVKISAVSVGQVYIKIDKKTDIARRKQLEQEFKNLLLTFEAYDAIAPFGGRAPKEWATLTSMTLMHDESSALSPESRMVVATAIAIGATLVDKKRPHHAKLPDLKVENP